MARRHRARRRRARGRRPRVHRGRLRLDLVHVVIEARRMPKLRVAELRAHPFCRARQSVRCTRRCAKVTGQVFPCALHRFGGALRPRDIARLITIFARRALRNRRLARRAHRDVFEAASSASASALDWCPVRHRTAAATKRARTSGRLLRPVRTLARQAHAPHEALARDFGMDAEFGAADENRVSGSRAASAYCTGNDARAHECHA